MSQSRVTSTSLTNLNLIQQALDRVCREWHTSQNPNRQWQGQVQVGQQQGQNQVQCDMWQGRGNRGCDIVVKRDQMPLSTYGDCGLFWDKKKQTYSWLMDIHHGWEEQFQADVESLYGALEAVQNNQQIGAVSVSDLVPATDEKLGNGWETYMEIDEDDLASHNIVLARA